MLGIATIILMAFTLGLWVGVAYNYRQIARNAVELKKLRAGWFAVRDLELRLQSKHNALKLVVSQRDEALQRLEACWQARVAEQKGSV